MLPFTKRESQHDGTERAPSPAASARPRPPAYADDDEMTRVMPSRSGISWPASREISLSGAGLSAAALAAPPPPPSTPAVSFTPPSGIPAAPPSLAPMAMSRAGLPSVPSMASLTPGSFAGFDPPAAVLTQSGTGATGARATLALGAGIAAIALVTAFAALLIVLRGAHAPDATAAGADAPAPELTSLPAAATAPAVPTADAVVVPSAPVAAKSEAPSSGVSTGTPIVAAPPVVTPAELPVAQPTAAAPPPVAAAAAPKAPRAAKADAARKPAAPEAARKPAAPASKPRSNAAREEMDRAREAKELADRQLADAL